MTTGFLKVTAVALANFEKYEVIVQAIKGEDLQR
jgi:hypothetical protein